jgi:hypothetical protein
MLNFLIPVIGDTFSRVNDRKLMYLYRYRNQLNIEYLEIRGMFLAAKQINCIVMICDQETYELEQAEFEEFSDLIIETVETTHKETRDQIVNMNETFTTKMSTMDNKMKEFKEQMGSMGKRMENVENHMQDIKSMIKSFVDN